MDCSGQRSEDAPGEGARGPARDEGQTWGEERMHVGLKEQRTPGRWPVTARSRSRKGVSGAQASGVSGESGPPLPARMERVCEGAGAGDSEGLGMRVGQTILTTGLGELQGMADVTPHPQPRETCPHGDHRHAYQAAGKTHSSCKVTARSLSNSPGNVACRKC